MMACATWASQERRHVTDLLAAQEALIHWCETLITAHADLVELASDADLLNLVEADEHEQRLTETRGVIEAHRRQAARVREGLSLKPRLVH